MSEVKKPTLVQMQKRPSLWTDDSDFLIIVYPNGKNEFMYSDWDYWSRGGITNSNEWMLEENFEFVSWL